MSPITILRQARKFRKKHDSHLQGQVQAKESLEIKIEISRVIFKNRIPEVKQGLIRFVITAIRKATEHLSANQRRVHLVSSSKILKVVDLAEMTSAGVW